jgi:MFS family permease
LGLYISAETITHNTQLYSDTQIGLLNAIYSLPDIVLILVGGVLVDRFGSARIMVWTATVCLVGAALTALSPGFVGMALGRLLFGIGAETLSVAVRPASRCRARRVPCNCVHICTFGKALVYSCSE